MLFEVKNYAHVDFNLLHRLSAGWYRLWQSARGGLAGCFPPATSEGTSSSHEMAWSVSSRVVHSPSRSLCSFGMWRLRQRHVSGAKCLLLYEYVTSSIFISRMLICSWLCRISVCAVVFVDVSVGRFADWLDGLTAWNFSVFSQSRNV